MSEQGELNTDWILTGSSLNLHSLAMFTDQMFLHCLHHFSNTRTEQMLKGF